ncbi:universal stress protein [Methylobacterium sp. NEAU K]|uniref:universal stress protein n=1 Tax=Methylobacterium sp. NEAU K TaxID=3064946 RepID=UPI002735C9EA|nr:universal stress protein [Methylobacterium sp. NEAU K]MDP4003356.1 universal stress protein [Methylobacterium sp. NEAU K]
MSYASIMVAVDDGRHASARVRLAADLAERFSARLVGVAACMPDYPQYYGETAAPMDLIFEEVRLAARGKLLGAEQVFRDAALPYGRVEWRADFDHPIRYLERQVLAADLVVVGRHEEDEGVDPSVTFAMGDVLMGLGRPVLVVPPGVEHVAAERIILGWKNSSQTRRAVSDAMPVLRRAEAVQVLRVTEGESRAEVEDVVHYLSLHDVQASAVLASPSGWTVADEMQKRAAELGADLIVTGAYGYSRLREWFFGGVTRDLLAKAPVCCLMSH